MKWVRFLFPHIDALIRPPAACIAEELRSDYRKGIAVAGVNGELICQLIEDGYTHGKQYTLGTLQFCDVTGNLYPDIRALGTLAITYLRAAHTHTQLCS